jgi:hypothetical protein
MARGRQIAGHALTGIVLAAAAWVGWNYYQFQTCGRRMCPASVTEPPIVLSSGRSLPVIALHVAGDGSVMLDYMTAVKAKSMREFCAEAREVWSAVQGWPKLAQASSVHLGLTRPRGEFIGMRWGVVPEYWCCTTTYLTVKKSKSGEWRFHQAACNARSVE